MDSEFVKSVLYSMDVSVSDGEAQALIALLMEILKDLRKLEDAAPGAHGFRFRAEGGK
jgi:hypothetical protein